MSHLLHQTKNQDIKQETNKMMSVHNFPRADWIRVVTF